jgi:hypothetical protein
MRRWRWALHDSTGPWLQAVGYQLGFMQPAQNPYLVARAEAVAALPVPIQRLLGFHMPGGRPLRVWPLSMSCAILTIATLRYINHRGFNPLSEIRS